MEILTNILFTIYGPLIPISFLLCNSLTMILFLIFLPLGIVTRIKNELKIKVVSKLVYLQAYKKVSLILILGYIIGGISFKSFVKIVCIECNGVEELGYAPIAGFFVILSLAYIKLKTMKDLKSFILEKSSIEINS